MFVLTFKLNLKVDNFCQEEKKEEVDDKTSSQRISELSSQRSFDNSEEIFNTSTTLFSKPMKANELLNENKLNTDIKDENNDRDDIKLSQQKRKRQRSTTNAQKIENTKKELEENHEMDHAQSRRRGRSKSNAQKIDQCTVKEHNDESNDEADITVSQPKRKRGRPKSSVQKNDENNVKELNADTKDKDNNEADIKFSQQIKNKRQKIDAQKVDKDTDKKIETKSKDESNDKMDVETQTNKKGRLKNNVQQSDRGTEKELGSDSKDEIANEVDIKLPQQRKTRRSSKGNAQKIDKDIEKEYHSDSKDESNNKANINFSQLKSQRGRAKTNVQKIDNDAEKEIFSDSKIHSDNEVNSELSHQKGKRGRPKRNIQKIVKDTEKEAGTDSNDETDYPFLHVRKRGRPNKNEQKIVKYSEEEIERDSQNESNSEADLQYSRPKRKNTFNTRRKRKKGRPKASTEKINKDAEYVPHHEYLRVLTETAKNKSEKKIAGKNSNVMVTCAKCHLEMSKNQWANHNLKEHNDLGWLEGKPNPDYENNEKLRKQVLAVAIKKKRGKLICEKCKLQRHSVDGYISHLNICGKTDEELKKSMVTCPGCQELIFKSSLDYHNKKHAMKIKKESKEKKEHLALLDNINSDSKTKRKAAERAANRMSSAMAKDDKDENDDNNSSSNHHFMRLMVQKPKLTKRISGATASKWKKDLDSGQDAVCSQPGCQFSCKSYIEIMEHFSKCNFTPQKNYVCKVCKFKTLEKDEIYSHISQKHPVEDLEDDVKLSESSGSEDSIGSGEEKEKTVKSVPATKRIVIRDNSRSTNSFKFIHRNSSCFRNNVIFSNSFKWTLDFEQKNYQLHLFKELKPNPFELLDKNKSNEFLPQLKESMPMKIMRGRSKNSINEWKRWKRFEGKIVEGGPMFFVGGPIWAMSWLTIPSTLAFSENVSQFIAISTHPSMDVEYSTGKNYKGKNIIQIWNVGNLNNKSDSKFKPKLAYAIAHEGGTVWSLEWCPSGCYDHEPYSNKENNEMKRLGLLAAGCSDGCIRVYSLTFPENLSSTENTQSSKNYQKDPDINDYPVYKTDPVLTLIVNIKMYESKKQTWQVTKLSWTKEKNHNVIVAGLSNGYVGLWNLTSKSPLLRHQRKNHIFLHPYRYFMAHGHAVTMVYLIPQDNKRFLATASLDRKYKFWDLENISSAQNTFQKSFVTNGSWLNNWGCAFIAYDDGLSLNHNYTYCIPLREYTYTHHNLIPTNSTSYAISTSDFGNSVANGTLAGEVLVMFPHQLLYARDMEKTLRYKRAICEVASVEVHDFHSEKTSKENGSQEAEYNFMPSTYDDSKDRFGLIFHDKVNAFQEKCFKKSVPKKTLTIDMMKSVPVEQYPFMSVNRVSWNPNAWSFLWLSVAYQNGFVQLFSFKSLACTSDWNKLLQSHINEVKKQTEETKSASTEDVFVTNNLLQELGF